MSKYLAAALDAATILMLCAFCIVPTTSAADERILNYFADIQVNEDASLLVTETIRVNVEGEKIQFGIYRDFPTRYRDRLGNRYSVDFELLEIKRDGRIENWHIQERSNGLRIYAGTENRRVEPGIHEYEIHYRTSRQLGHFEDRDELYWNVTGTGWAFAIEQAGARIQLPFKVDPADLQVDWYTGAQGESGKAARFSVSSADTIEFATTQPLGPREGLTVALSWPAGLVERPDTIDRAHHFFTDNAGTLVLLVGFLLTLAWYLWAWNRYGRDPAKGVIIPRFAPPPGLSPAACRYILDMGLANQAFTAAVVSLGVKGWLRIEEDDEEFTLHRHAVDGNEAPSPGEQKVLDALLPGHNSSIVLENENHAAFGKARTGLKTALAGEHKNRLFRLNSWFMVPALVISAVSIGLATQWPFAVAALVIFLMASALMHLLFVWLLRAPTPGGRLVMDEIEGFQMYLKTAEQQRLDQMRSPVLTPEIFEAFLPYAFALGVENQWASRFETEFPQQVDGNKGFHPAWYSGNLHSANSLGHISSGLSSSLSSAIASASSPPGSSSGSGGGGFSGGGGGGGGGGGW